MIVVHENKRDLAPLDEGFLDIFKRKPKSPEELRYKEECRKRIAIIETAANSLREFLFRCGINNIDFTTSSWYTNNSEFSKGSSPEFEIFISVDPNVGTTENGYYKDGKYIPNKTIDYGARLAALSEAIKAINSSKSEIIQNISDDIKYNVSNLKLASARNNDEGYVVITLEKIPFVEI